MGVEAKKMSNSIAAAGDFGERLKSCAMIITEPNDALDAIRLYYLPGFRRLLA